MRKSQYTVADKDCARNWAFRLTPCFWRIVIAFQWMLVVRYQMSYFSCDRDRMNDELTRQMIVEIWTFFVFSLKLNVIPASEQLVYWDYLYQSGHCVIWSDNFLSDEYRFESLMATLLVFRVKLCDNDTRTIIGIRNTTWHRWRCIMLQENNLPTHLRIFEFCPQICSFFTSLITLHRVNVEHSFLHH